MKRLINIPPVWWYWDVRHDPIGFFQSLYGEVKDSIHRGIYGWANRDFWNANDHLAYMIEESCTWLINNMHGVPPHLLDENNEPDEKKWHEILSEIRYGFMFYQETIYDCNSKTVDKIRKRNLKRSFKLLEEYFAWMWD